MVLRPSLVLLVLVVMGLLQPLAYASPPDPNWIAGFWDDGDYDDVVLLATSSVGTLDTHECAAAVRIAVVSTSVCLLDESLSLDDLRSSWRTRASRGVSLPGAAKPRTARGQNPGSLYLPSQHSCVAGNRVASRDRGTDLLDGAHAPRSASRLRALGPAPDGRPAVTLPVTASRTRRAPEC